MWVAGHFWASLNPCVYGGSSNEAIAGTTLGNGSRGLTAIVFPQRKMEESSVALSNTLRLYRLRRDELEDYEIQKFNSASTAYNKNIRIQKLSDGRWATFVRTSYFDNTLMPIGPIHPSKDVASQYLDWALFDKVS